MIEKPKEIHLTAWKEMFEKSQNNNHLKHNFNLFWTSALKEECFTFSAKNEGEFLGFIVASIFEGFFEKYLFLETIFVDQSYRKMGVGRALLNKVEEIKIIEFDHKDVVRHPLVSKIIKAYQKNFDDKN